MSTLRIMLALSVLALFAAPAAAQTSRTPDVRGTWTCRGEALRAVTAEQSDPQVISADAEYVIQEQQGSRFWGTKNVVRNGETLTERILGVVLFDNRTVILIDHDGKITWTLSGTRRALGHYAETGEVLVISRMRCTKRR